ncbi:Rap1a/Tai family immunity protein, partial [Nitrosococcus oceani]
VANDFVTRPELWGRQLWCIPEEESLEAVAQIVIAELKTPPGNSETSSYSYPAAVMKSLKKRYPCP